MQTANRPWRKKSRSATTWRVPVRLGDFCRPVEGRESNDRKSYLRRGRSWNGSCLHGGCGGRCGGSLCWCHWRLIRLVSLARCAASVAYPPRTVLSGITVPPPHKYPATALPILTLLSITWTAWDPTYASLRRSQIQGREVRQRGKREYNVSNFVLGII